MVGRLARLGLCLVLLSVLLPGCAGRKARPLEPPTAVDRRVPLILVPGITGSQLRRADDGEVVWGRGRNIFVPRDGGYTLALPLDPATRRDHRLEAVAPILDIRVLGLLRVDVYGGLVELLQRHGYRLGSLDAPRPSDSLFVFPYDWRLSNVSAAGLLAGELETLRRARGVDVLEVDFICQSNAARIVRYLAKYGGASLETAEAGEAGPPSNLRPRKVIMVGGDNGGALSTFDDLHRGRTYVPLIGRRIHPETVFTFPSLYEALPAHRRDLFFDASGRLLDVDLFDAATWERRGWSIFSRRSAARADRRPDLFGDARSRREFLTESLDRGARLHALLLRDVSGFAEPTYYLVQNAYRPTGDRALLLEREGSPHVKFAADRAVRREPYLSSLAAAPGDGYATLESQVLLSPQEAARLVRPSPVIPARHREIVRHPAARRWILNYLLD